MTWHLLTLNVTVKDGERALLTRNGQLVRVLAPGKHRLFDPLHELKAEVLDVVRSEFPADRYAVLKAARPDLAADLFEATRDITAAAGLPAYEISNHARPGAESRHNLTYWRYGDYAGVGPGAHGRRGGLATMRHKKPENWMAAVTRNGHGLQLEDPLAPHERAVEALVMGLRLPEGVHLPRVAALAGGTAPLDSRALAVLSDQGLVTQDGERLYVTAAGTPVLEAILRELVIA